MFTENLSSRFAKKLIREKFLMYINFLNISFQIIKICISNAIKKKNINIHIMNETLYI